VRSGSRERCAPTVPWDSLADKLRAGLGEEGEARVSAGSGARLRGATTPRKQGQSQRGYGALERCHRDLVTVWWRAPAGARSSCSNPSGQRTRT
jgi:hypothetical protein